MNRKTNKDWTDALRESVESAELTPSAGGWERLSADLRPRRAAWWPYAVSAAACAAVCAALMFRSPAPAGQRINVVPSRQLVAEAVAEAAQPEEAAATLPAAGESTAAEAEPAFDAASLRHFSAVPAPPLAQDDHLQHFDAVPTLPIASEEAAVAETEAVPAETEPVPASDAATAEAGQPEASHTSSRPATKPQPAPQYHGYEAPWRTEERKPRRHVTVTVSAGGAFGSGSSHSYIAKSYATKADDSVIDLSEVIQHDSPRQASLGVQLPLTDRLGIGSGLDYLNLTSSVGPASQQLQWIGVPLTVDYCVADWGQSKLFINAGARGEKCLSASLLGLEYNEPFQLAANFGAEYKVSLFGPVALSFIPEFSYYFTQTVLPTYRSNRPLTFNLCAGLSVQL